MFCQRPDIYRKKFSDIKDHFSVKIETKNEEQKAVTFPEEHYDFSEKLVFFVKTRPFGPRILTIMSKTKCKRCEAMEAVIEVVDKCCG